MADATAPSRELSTGRRRAWRRRRTLVLALTIGLAACSGAPTAVRLQVPKGASVAQVAESLGVSNAIPSTLAFRILARAAGVDRKLKPGLYDIPAGASMQQIIQLLERGVVASTRFTVREGLTLYEIASLAEARLGIPADSLIAAATDRAAAQQVLAGAPSFEGVLFPETYLVPGDITARGLVTLLADQFRATWDSTWDAKAASLGLTRLQALTLASLVEGEARADDERATIAGVYYNRWQIGMALQADPTVQYAIVQRDGGRKPRLFLKDYETPSPYNTYLHPGFPPGPVNSPGRASIEAALAPATVPYRFFVAGPDGRHRFATTFDEHRRNVAAMRRLWSAERRERGN